VETSVWWLARELAAAGEQVCVVGGHSQRPRPELPPGVEVVTFPYTPRERFPHWGSRFRKLMERLSLARRAVPFLGRGGFQRLVIFKPYDLGPAVAAARAGRMRVGFLAGGSEFYPGYAALARRLHYFAAVSRFTADQIAAATGLRPQVNYLGVDTNCFRPVAPDQELAARLGLAPEDEVVVSAVRLVALKGLQDALAALHLLRRRRPRVKLVVAGEGPYRQELLRLAAELGLDDAFRLAGFLPPERLAGFYALGRVAVFPSQGEEALGLSAAEALACEVPVVASRVGGLPEVVGETCGLLVPSKQPEALARALDELLDSARRREMGRAGRRWVEERFTWRACALRLAEGLAD
jgi:glycosyltransferase involved in cell wall biosynthesis